MLHRTLETVQQTTFEVGAELCRLPLPGRVRMSGFSAMHTSTWAWLVRKVQVPSVRPGMRSPLPKAALRGCLRANQTSCTGRPHPSSPGQACTTHALAPRHFPDAVGEVPGTNSPQVIEASQVTEARIGSTNFPQVTEASQVTEACIGSTNSPQVMEAS